MAEAVQEQQQVEPQVPLDTSDDALLGRAMGLEDPAAPRDEKGRFVSQKPAAEATQEAPQEQQQPAQGEDPADKPAEQSEPAAKQEEVKWEDVKDVKIKVPMKVGEKEWEDEVTLEQLRSERMMQSDYTRKTQEVAERERQADAMAQQAIEKERGQYLEALTALQSTIRAAAVPELANVNWDQLVKDNPVEYHRLQNRVRQVNEAMQSVALEQEKIRAQQSEASNKSRDQAVAESRVKLREAIPQWNDDLYQSLLKRSYDTYGFKPDEMSGIWDHRIMRVLHDAHQWRATQEGKPLAEKKVVNVPSVLKPGNAKPKVDPRTNEFQKAKARLAANGNDGDAAEAMMATFITPRK